MSIITTNFNSPARLQWQWPLKVGLLPGADHLQSELLQLHWPQVFTSVEQVSGTSSQQHYNLLFVGPDQHSSGVTPAYSADIIVALVKNIDTKSFSEIKRDELIKQFNATGLFILSLGDNRVSVWFNDFIVELSHNMNVVDSVKRTVQDANLFFDERVEMLTTLSSVIENLVHLLRSGRFVSPRFSINSRVLGNKNFTARELAIALESIGQTFVYRGEGGDATSLHEISKVLFEEQRQAPHKIKKGRSGSTGRIMAPPKIGSDSDRWLKKSSDKNVILNFEVDPGKLKPLIVDLDTAKATELKVDDNPRYLQAAVRNAKNKFVKKISIVPAAYKLEVMIGYPDTKFINSGEQFDTEEVFWNSKKKEETIQVKFRYNFDKKIQFQEIKLPRTGNSSSADFTFITKAGKKFKGDLYAYHKNRLIQHLELNDKLKMSVVLSARRNLGNITRRTPFAASLEYKAQKKNASTLSGVSAYKPIDLYFSDGLKGHLQDMKEAIEEALLKASGKNLKLNAAANYELLLFLATKGSLIYINHLRGAIAPEGPLQIITKRQEYVPLDFVYSLNPPIGNAKLCKNAAEALKEGTCKKCFDHSLNPAPHICPFGFWTFNRIVERHSYQKTTNSTADYSILAEPDDKRNTLTVLQNTIFGSSHRVENIREQIITGIEKNTLKLYKANDWKKWSALVHDHRPDSLILVVHIENDKKMKIDKIEIGNDFVMQVHFGSTLLLKKEMTTPPFIVIIGCEATNLAAPGFDVSSQLINEGAAIVLSNFTKIKGSQAKIVVLMLLDFIRQKGKNKMLFGEIMLKLRQHLLAEGVMAGLSLIAQGDADWKIKT